MKIISFLSALAFVAAKSDESFDYYLLAQTFQPLFCSTGNYAGCENPTEFMKTNLTIHGLWPNYNDGTFPSFCSDEKLSKATIEAIGQDTINTYWPDVKTNYGTNFISNEWDKHGTCSGMNQLDYIGATIDLEIELGTPEIISSNVGKSVVGSEIRKAYGGDNMVALVCVHGALSEVRTCYKNTESGPGDRMPCPENILKRDNCGKKTGKKIAIYSFEDL
ncbi:hypothetical protein THRCLA_07675 [Thraustotheca clavata]|uniref:Secreted protein n=1 Tax=Thraustotheca clavata TaxID=74557 RepID=A0A0A7CMB0_9STRA|nr:secreted protein [Thraustotheca clavata]OQR95663.1 hypothetical protein THRCLA_07675 [Thraustotheca clavata]